MRKVGVMYSDVM